MNSRDNIDSLIHMMKSFVVSSSSVKASPSSKSLGTNHRGPNDIDLTQDSLTLARHLLQSTFTEGLLERLGIQPRGFPIIHFFKSEYFYYCYGPHAIQLADEFYGTRQLLRQEQNLEILEVNKKLMKKIASSLIERRVHVIFWNRIESIGWKVKLQALPGDYLSLEAELGSLDRSSFLSDFVATVSFMTETNQLAAAFVSLMQSQIVLMEFNDDQDFSRIRNLCTQHSTCRLILLLDDVKPLNEESPSQNESILKSKNLKEFTLLKKSLEKIGIVLEVKTLNDYTFIDQTSSSMKFKENIQIRTIEKLENLLRKAIQPNNTSQPIKGLYDIPTSLYCLGSLLIELKVMDSLSYDHSFDLSIGSMKDYLIFDESVIQSLQLFPDSQQTLSVRDDTATSSAARIPNTSRSLYDLLNQTNTGMGTRLLRQWLEKPSTHRPTILHRQNCIKHCIQSLPSIQQLRDQTQYLKGFPDFLRIIIRLRSYQQQSSSLVLLKDLLESYKCILRIQQIDSLLQDIAQQLSSSSSSSECGDLSFFTSFSTILKDFTKYLLLIEELIDDDYMKQYSHNNNNNTTTSFQLHRDRFIRIKPTFTTELQYYYDQIKQIELKIMNHYHLLRQQIQLNEKELNFEYSDVHNWYFRITKRLSTKVLKLLDEKKIKYSVLSYQKAGTLFVTNELKNLLTQFDQAKYNYQESQENIVRQALEVIQTYTSSMFTAAHQVALLDVYCTLATIAVKHDWICPEITSYEDGKKLMIKQMRHPLLEERTGSIELVKNDAHIDDKSYACIVSGPNMGGKSTYLKAIGFIVLLTQIGSFVPAEAAMVPIYDHIFYRSGSHDFSNLGISSFMLEMLDMSHILQIATKHSLVLIDELGSGTSTSDGFGIAWALLSEITEKNQSTIFCASHFYELNYLTQEIRDSLPSEMRLSLLEKMKKTEEEKEEAVSSHVFQSLHVDAYVNTDAREVMMLYQILPGASNRSYGINVARLVDFPCEIIEKATEIEKELQQSIQVVRDRGELDDDGNPRKRQKV